MLHFTYPGVYTQEIPSGVRAVSGAPTSVALFIGPTLTGIDGRPIRLHHWGDFDRNFGGYSQTSSLSYSVAHFFANGGGDAFVIRVPSKDAVAATSAFKKDNGANDGKVATLKALSSGLAGNDLFLEFDSFGIGTAPFTATPDKKRFNLTVTDLLTGRSERFTNLSTSSSNTRYAAAVVGDTATGSKLVGLTVNEIDVEGPRPTGSIYKIGVAPSAGGAPFAADVKLRLSVTVRDDAGADDAAASIKDLEVIVFRKDEARPTSVLELVTRLASAINSSIRADIDAVKAMQGLAIEAAPFEGGSLIRLRVAFPTSGRPSKRVADATVTVKGMNNAATFLSPYELAVAGENVSRYQLGAAYTGGQLADAAVPGEDGDANGQPATDTFKAAIMALEPIDPFFNILCLPDLVRPKANDPAALLHAGAMSLYAEAARICQLKHAFLLIDPLPSVTDVGAAEAYKSLGFSFQSSHSAAYFPNIRVDDPLEPGTIRSHPPSGAMAGVFARTDAQVGVWQAPAGTEAVLSGVYGPSVALSDDDQGVLNPLGLNCIRRFPIYGTVSFGSRTVDGANAQGSEWKYIPVRRTASYILRSLSDALRWAVHKPNGEQLWSQLRMNSTAFMHGLFRQGAFKGVSSREAYFVLCDASTTSADDMNEGVVNIVIGFAPLRPAEFVVISLRQMVQAAA